MPRRTTHRDEISGGGQLFITIAMPLDPAFGFAMVVIFFEDWIPHDYYSYAENLRGVLVSGDFRFFLLGIWYNTYFKF